MARRLFYSPNELRAEPLLSEVASKHGLSIFPHVKLSHVIDTRPGGVTAEVWKYATRAEFDWVIVDA